MSNTQFLSIKDAGHFELGPILFILHAQYIYALSNINI
jgi:hypothetical protein